MGHLQISVKQSTTKCVKSLPTRGRHAAPPSRGTSGPGQKDVSELIPARGCRAKW